MNAKISLLKVKKSNGDLVPFDYEKLKHALLRSGAQIDDIDEIVNEVFESVYDGISTKKIYHIAYKILRKHSKNVAGRYRLKKALFDLGPTGYSFEKFMGRLFERKGYQVQVGQIVEGVCVSHEVDVVAQKDNEIIMVECKFHRQQGRKSDVKVALYIKSRFEDIKTALEKKGELKNKTFRGFIATNTRFTDDAIQFGKCSGLELLAWNYPSHKNLQKWIEESDYHPVTALGSATNRIKSILLDNNIVLCREVIEQEEKLLSLRIPMYDIKKIVKEAQEIVGAWYQ